MVTKEETAEILWVSRATLHNREKAWLIKNKWWLFSKFEVLELKSKIERWEVDRLNSRANKTKSKSNFIPKEYLQSKKDSHDVQKIVLYCLGKGISIANVVINLAINLWKNNWVSNQKFYKLEIESFKKEYQFTDDFFLQNCRLPNQEDILWLIYQSIKSEWDKANAGSYYTPLSVVERQYDSHGKDWIILDPCVWTWQYLLKFWEWVSDPSQLWWFDIDDIAVRITRLNLITKFKDKDFSPNVFCKNFITDDLWLVKVDVIATNPPRWAFFSDEEKWVFQFHQPNIKSFESFSYFINKGISLLAKDWILSYILPESVTNIKIHADIRKIILDDTDINYIEYMWKKFTKVMSNVIRIDLKKWYTKNIEVNNLWNKYSITENRFYSNKDYMFDIFMSDYDKSIIDKIYTYKNSKLDWDNAIWALWIVTWNNKKYVSLEKTEDNEDLILWKNISRYEISDIIKFIKFTPNEFQQTAKEEIYRAEEKLIYRFISRQLEFYYDDKQKLPLNSANILIPKIDWLPIKYIAWLLNSKLFQFIYEKKFNALKVLKWNLQELPIFLMWNKEINIIVELVDKRISWEKVWVEIDKYIMTAIWLNDEEILYILNE